MLPGRRAALAALLLSAVGFAADGGARAPRTLADVRLLVVRAAWCPSCKRLEASGVLPRVAARFPGLAVVEVDVDRDVSALERYGVEAIPALVLVDATGFPLGRPKVDLEDADEGFRAIERAVTRLTKGAVRGSP